MNALAKAVLLTAATLAVSRVEARESCTLITLKNDYKGASVVFLGESIGGEPGTARFRVIQAWATLLD